MSRIRGRTASLTGLVLWLLAVMTSVQALAAEEGAEPQRRDWHFFVAPYFWLAGIDGTVVVDGQASDLDASVSDLASQARGVPFQLYAEAAYRRWFIAFDGTWATLGGDAQGTLLNLDVEVRQRLFDVRLGYAVRDRVVGEPDPGGDPRWQRRSYIGVFGGARYFSTKPTITAEFLGDPPTSGSSVDRRWDPFVGFRAAHSLSRRWLISVRADVGRTGSTGNLTWQFATDGGYRLTRMVTLFAGFRLLSFDTVEGEGGNRNGADLLQNGPLLGAGFSF